MKRSETLKLMINAYSPREGSYSRQMFTESDAERVLNSLLENGMNFIKMKNDVLFIGKNQIII